MTTAMKLGTVDQGATVNKTKAHFASRTVPAARLRVREREMLSRALARRLASRAANFDREASRLELRGQGEAALVLRREATRISQMILKEPVVGLA